MRLLRAGRSSVTHAELSQDFLDALVALVFSEHTEAIVLAGSTVRGDATPYSDVDLAHIVHPSYAGPDKRFHYREGVLISVNARTIEWWRQAVTQPERAIFIVPAMQDARILLDPQGTFAQYRAELATFTWAPLQTLADRFAGATVAAQAETVHKILSALVRGEGMYEPVAMLTLDLTRAMAVQRGVLISSSAVHMREVRRAMGDTSAWSRCHRLATGELDEGESHPTSRQQAHASLQLYRETVRLLEDIMLPDRRELALSTARVVDEALGGGGVLDDK
jgi:nucleotidyltransferase-like protein